MVSPYSRFVVHYRDGETVVEDKNDPYAWDKLRDKDDILALGIKMDKLFLHKEKLRIERPQHMLYSSKNKRHFFFQTKEISMMAPEKDTVGVPIDGDDNIVDRNTGKWFNCHRIGMIFSKEGDCQVIDVDAFGNTKCYVTTLDSILPHANLELFGIDLSRVGEPIG